MRHLLALGVRVKISGMHHTPLHDLAESGAAAAPMLVQELVEAAPWQLTYKDNTGAMPVDRAKSAGQRQMVRALESAAMMVTGAERAMMSRHTHSFLSSCLSVATISLDSPGSSVTTPPLGGGVTAPAGSRRDCAKQGTNGRNLQTHITKGCN